ncbi:hypothetical protein BDR04DRAFT_1161474 [Suillus decipiens]|nr:hypothetical protein BDR04DRAFT_1161474 [Suillus decipiens]
MTQALVIKTWLVALNKSTAAFRHMKLSSTVPKEDFSDEDFSDCSNTSSFCADNKGSAVFMPSTQPVSMKLTPCATFMHIRKLTKDIADPWSCKYVPQLIPSLIFSKGAEALEEPNTDDDIFD